MQIKDLGDADLNSYLGCLEEWSDALEPGKCLKREWYARMKEKGLRVKLAVDEDGVTCGMIQYMPAEHTHVRANGFYFVYCIWVHGHKKGIGNRQHKGFGKALLTAAEDDAKSLGAIGMAAWGLRIPVWMKASWFLKQGYRIADRQGMAALVWKAWSPDAVCPSLPRLRKKPVAAQDKVVITDFVNGWCTYGNVTHANIKKISTVFGDRVELISLDATDPAVLEQWGIGEGLFINGKEVRTAPPLAYDKLKSIVERQVRKLH